MDIREYLLFLENEGWSDLIDERWKEKVYQELLARFPAMSADEWKKIEETIFI